MPTGNQKQIQEFLTLKRWAIIGVSRNPKEFSRVLFNDMRKYGYDVVPINSKTTEIEGVPCFHSIGEVNPLVDVALLLAAKEDSETIVKECDQAGIRHIWLYGIGTDGLVNQSALKYCQENGIAVIAGYCPYMFLKNSPFFHKMHCWFLKLSGAYPKAT